MPRSGAAPESRTIEPRLDRPASLHVTNGSLSLTVFLLSISSRGIMIRNVLRRDQGFTKTWHHVLNSEANTLCALCHCDIRVVIVP